MYRRWAALVVSAQLFAATVEAGNDDGILLGNDAALVAGAVVASVNDGSALWYNPAGLALVGDDSVDVSASAFALRRYEIPAFITADDGTRSDASFNEIVTIPSALTFVRLRAGPADDGHSSARADVAHRLGPVLLSALPLPERAWPSQKAKSRACAS